MSTIKVEVQLSLEELLKAVDQLSLPDLEQFASKVLVIQAQRKAPTLPQSEAELLLKINQSALFNVIFVSLGVERCKALHFLCFKSHRIEFNFTKILGIFPTSAS
jgi:hypothetical protein